MITLESKPWRRRCSRFWPTIAARTLACSNPNRVGLTNAQFALLETVAIHGTGGVSAIAAAAGLTQPSTTRALARLHTKGLLERQKDPARCPDHRHRGPPQGAELLTQHRRRLRNAAQTLHDALPAASRKHAVPLLSSLGEALDELL